MAWLSLTILALPKLPYNVRTTQQNSHGTIESIAFLLPVARAMNNIVIKGHYSIEYVPTLSVLKRENAKEEKK